MYLDNTVDNMLKGINEQVKSMQINIIDSCFCLLMVMFLLPKCGIYGYLFTICAGEILNFSLSLGRLIKISSVSIKLYQNIFVPFFSVTVCCLIFRIFPNNFGIFAKLPICIALYSCFVSCLGGFTKNDRIWLKNAIVSKHKSPVSGQNN